MSKKRFYAKKKEDNKIIAKKRINILFDQARSVYTKNFELSNRYVELARNISMKYRTKLTSNQKRLFCKNCHTYLIPSKNCRVRVHDKKIIYYCFQCKTYNRLGYDSLYKSKND